MLLIHTEQIMRNKPALFAYKTKNHTYAGTGYKIKNYNYMYRIKACKRFSNNLPNQTRVTSVSSPSIFSIILLSS